MGFRAHTRPCRGPRLPQFREGRSTRGRKMGIGIQAIKVFCKAFLLRSLSPTECLRYTLSQPVHVAICGAGSQGQMEDNIRTVQSMKKPRPKRLPTCASEPLSARESTPDPPWSTGRKSSKTPDKWAHHVIDDTVDGGTTVSCMLPLAT